MIERDDHDGTFQAAPCYRHLLPANREITLKIQLLEILASVVHNHPSGDPTPSNADIEMTKKIIETAKPLGIAIHDHLVIGKGRHASFRTLGLI